MPDKTEYMYDNTYNLSVRMTEEQRVKLEYVVDRLGCSKSKFIRNWIDYSYDVVKLAEVEI